MELQKLDKDNKRLKGTNTTLTSRRITFERVRSLWAAKKGTWCAIDFEAWDRDHTLLLEVGWSIVQWTESGEEVSHQTHLVVQERRKFYNTYVPSYPDVSSPFCLFRSFFFFFIHCGCFFLFQLLTRASCRSLFMDIEIQFWPERTR